MTPRGEMNIKVRQTDRQRQTDRHTHTADGTGS